MAAMARVYDLRCPSAQPNQEMPRSGLLWWTRILTRRNGKQQHTQEKLETVGAETCVNPRQARLRRKPRAGQLSRPVGYVGRVSA